MRVAAGLSDAVDLLASGRPRLLLLDCATPGWLDLLRVARLAYGEQLPVLLAGAADRPSDAARVVGADAYLRLPFDPDELPRRVSALIAAGAPPAP